MLAFIAIVSVFAILVAAAACPGQHFELPKGSTDSPRDVLETPG